MSMSNIPNETEIQGTGILNNNRNSRKHSVHGHLSFKPASVIDHIKTKVKRKHGTNSIGKDVSIIINNNNSITDNNKNNNNSNNNYNSNSNVNQATEDNTTLDSKVTTTTTMPVPSILLLKSSGHYSDESNENRYNNEENGLLTKKPELGSNALQRTDKDENSSEQVHWRIDAMDSDADNNRPSVQTKSLPIKRNQSDNKKARPSVRCKSFQIRDEDFNAIFSDLTPTEQLIVAYPCAWRKDTFMHGKVFLSINFVCFHACFLKWKESLSLNYKDITSITREKSAKIVPNAIKLRTKNRQQYFIASYIPRERIFIALFRLWQNALLNQPLNHDQLKAIVYADQMNIEESSDDSDGFIEGDNNTEFLINRYSHSQSLPQIHSNNSPKSSSVSVATDYDMSSSLPNPPQTNYVSTCPCETHLSRTFADKVLLTDADTIFELIFGDNPFSQSCHDSQKLLDYVIGEWITNSETGKRERQVTYRTVTQSILGTNTIFCTEKQTVELERPRSVYVIRTDVFNEGMKYTDAFFVATQFCIFQRDAERCSLRVNAQIKYVKNVNPIAKAFIEKNANGSIEGGVNNLIRRLELRQEQLMSRPSSNRKLVSILKEQSLATKIDDNGSFENKDHVQFNAPIVSVDLTANDEYSMNTRLVINISLALGIFLIVLHIYLCAKLSAIDQALFSPDVYCLNQCKEACSRKLSHL